jgi:hypothetical protein
MFFEGGVGMGGMWMMDFVGFLRLSSIGGIFFF